MIDMNSVHFRKLSDVDIAQERVTNKILNNIAKNYGLLDYFYLGGISTLRSLLDARCKLDKELIFEYLTAYKDFDEVRTAVKVVIDAVITEHEVEKKI